MDRERIAAALVRVQDHLLSKRNAAGYWEGRLSSSPLSTAVAITALRLSDRDSPRGAPDHRELVDRGAEWILSSTNPDGGWGDTDRSRSNISTTVLCWAALGLAGRREGEEGARSWLLRHAGGTSPAQVATAIARRYGRDRTFAVPILTMAALCGRLGQGREAWQWVRPLPFELAALPAGWYSRLRLPVVSYALPALIAMGIVRHAFLPPRSPILRSIRSAFRGPCLGVLGRIQPSNGGFLEAAPLTGFVAMSLAAARLAHHPVTRRAIGFLTASVRADGSWPIDTDLSTWVTTLALDALAHHGPALIAEEKRKALAARLCRVQQRGIHPYTRARPGGWAWTDRPGGVPDADDTAGALAALYHLGVRNYSVVRSIRAGCRWLQSIQNRDGGIPTFCRGWGHLPFDRSSEDITAHAVRAWSLWLPELDGAEERRTRVARRRAVGFLLRRQRGDGSWCPLWFGNQELESEENPLYGTARVLSALAGLTAGERPEGALLSGLHWLVLNQNEDGGWGGACGATSTIEESSLAVAALCALGQGPGWVRSARDRGVDWLLRRVESGDFLRASPIGFYFARLWYYEALYPPVFLAGALRQAQGAVKPD